jgi:hypothetical protein
MYCIRNVQHIAYYALGTRKSSAYKVSGSFGNRNFISEYFRDGLYYELELFFRQRGYYVPSKRRIFILEIDSLYLVEKMALMTRTHKNMIEKVVFKAKIWPAKILVCFF